MVFCLVVCFGVNLFVTIFLCSVLFREVLLPHCRFKGYCNKYLIHPEPHQIQPEALVSSTADPPEVHPVLFEQLTGQSIRNAALTTQGSAGPSGIDAAGWRRICTAFHRESSDLCTAIALVGHRLCSDFVDPVSLRPFLACRLIPLNKNPGVRPIGVCEVFRRIVGKAVMQAQKCFSIKIPFQKCAGCHTSCE